MWSVCSDHSGAKESLDEDRTGYRGVVRHRGLEAESGDPLLPLAIGRAISFESFEPPLFAATCSPNLNVAARRLAQRKKPIGPMRLAVAQSQTETGLRIV